MSWHLDKAAEVHPVDGWDFYLCTIDDNPASIFVDLDRIDTIPANGFRHMFYLRVHMKCPRPDGLSSNEEFEALCKLEDELADAWQRAGMIYVGRNTCQSVRDFHLYVEDVETAEKVSTAIMRSWGNYTFETGGRDDQAWSFYREFLFPGSSGMRSIKNRRVLETLRSHGDDASQKHHLDHRAYFRSRTSREAFVARILSLGFDIFDLGEDMSDATLYADFSRWDILEDIDCITGEIEAICENVGGVYDGWGTEVLS